VTLASLSTLLICTKSQGMVTERSRSIDKPSCHRPWESPP